MSRQLESFAPDDVALVGRRLESKLIVEFEVLMTEETKTAGTQKKVEDLAAGDSGVAAGLALSVERGLKDQNIDASVDSAAATKVETRSRD